MNFFRSNPKDIIKSPPKSTIPVMSKTPLSKQPLRPVISMNDLQDNIRLPRRMTQKEKEWRRIENNWEGFNN